MYTLCIQDSLEIYIIKWILSFLEHLVLFSVGLHNYFCSVDRNSGCQEVINSEPESHGYMLLVSHMSKLFFLNSKC